MLEPLGQSQVLSYIELLSVGREIALISFEKKSDLKDAVNMSMVRSRLESVNIYWVPLCYHKSPLVLATAFDIVTGIVVALYLSLTRRIHIIHARSYVPALIAVVIKHLSGVRFLFDMRGFWADERADGGLWPKGGGLYSVAKWFEWHFFVASDHLVTLTNASLAPLSELIPKRRVPLPITVIPTCADMDRFRPVSGRGGDVAFTLGYVGSIGTWYLLDEMLALFKACQRRRSNSRLLVINRNNHLAVKAGMVRFDIAPSQVDLISAEHSEVPGLIGNMDAGLMLIKPCFSKLASAPTKLAEYLGCGVPCFGNIGVGDVEEILETNHVGVVLHSFDQSAIDEAVERMLILLNDAQIGLRCRAVAETFFSLDDGIKNMLRFMNPLR